jgi:hypothetical protein
VSYITHSRRGRKILGSSVYRITAFYLTWGRIREIYSFSLFMGANRMKQPAPFSKNQENCRLFSRVVPYLISNIYLAEYIHYDYSILRLVSRCARRRWHGWQPRRTFKFFCRISLGTAILLLLLSQYLYHWTIMTLGIFAVPRDSILLRGTSRQSCCHCRFLW